MGGSYRRIGPTIQLALLVAVPVVSAVAPAAASTATLVELPPAPCKPLAAEPCLPPVETALVYAAGGERNRVTLRPAPGGRIGISDRGTVIQPGRGCARVDEHSVTCEQPSASRLQTLILVGAAGGADVVRSGLRLGVGMDGGSGNDVLVGGAGPDLLFGGSGTDRLRGLGGNDRLHEASLRSFLSEAVQPARPLPARTISPGSARDSYDGGSGTDTVSYTGRRAKLRIDLAGTKARAGARGERDAIRRVEHALGGAGDDRLAGSRRANLLDGAEGDDVIAGGAGADRLQGGEGDDVLRGGSGSDAINFPGSGSASADRISCGSGRDLIGTVFPRDLVAGDCDRLGFYPPEPPEKLQVLGAESLLPLRRGRPPRVLRGGLGCVPDTICLARTELRVRGPGSRGGTTPPPGTLLGSQAVSVNGTETKAFELSLSSAGLGLLQRHRALRVRVILGSQFSSAESLGYTTVLRAP